MKTLSLSVSSLKNKTGFTLVELMIVIAIIGILAASLFPSLSRYLSRGRDTTRISEIKQLNTAFISYQVDKNTYKIPGTGQNGSGNVWVNLTGVFGTASYTKSISVGLQELGYMTAGIKQKTASDYLLDPATYTVGSCQNINPRSKDLYMFFYNDTTGQYAVSGHLENAKEADADNIVLSYGGVFACTQYGRNYAVGKN